MQIKRSFYADMLEKIGFSRKIWMKRHRLRVSSARAAYAIPFNSDIHTKHLIFRRLHENTFWANWKMGELLVWVKIQAILKTYFIASQAHASHGRIGSRKVSMHNRAEPAFSPSNCSRGLCRPLKCQPCRSSDRIRLFKSRVHPASHPCSHLTWHIAAVIPQKKGANTCFTMMLAKKQHTWKQVFRCCTQITWALGHISLACPIIHGYSVSWINLQTSIKECNSMTGSSAMCSSQSLAKNNRRLRYGRQSFENIFLWKSLNLF